MTDDPPPLDPAGVIAALEQHQVRYVVIGGIAAQLHGSTTPTRGFDLTPERSTPNLVRLAAALASIEAREWVPGFGYPLQLPMDRRRLAGERVLLTQTRYGRVDVVPVPHGVPGGYDELQPRAGRVAGYGADVTVAALDDLVRSHAAAGRAKDKVALSGLIDLRLGGQGHPLPPHIQQPSASASSTLYDALAASEQLAVVFDVIRPQVAYVRRELYRAVDSVMYGDAASTRDAIDRAHHAASNAQLDVQRLAVGGAKDGGARRLQHASKVDVDPGEQMAVQADRELRATLGLLASAPTRGDAPAQLRDLLIEARVHAAAADNHLDQLQIRLEHAARAWEREPPMRGEFFGRD